MTNTIPYHKLSKAQRLQLRIEENKRIEERVAQAKAPRNTMLRAMIGTFVREYEQIRDSRGMDAAASFALQAAHRMPKV